MKAFLGFPHSHNFWLRNGSDIEPKTYGCGSFSTVKAVGAKPAPNTKPNTKTILSLGLPEDLSRETVHLVVDDKQSIVKTANVLFTIWHNPPRGTFAQLDDALFILTPEACFAILAHHLSTMKLHEIERTILLAQYGFMLCGSYAIDAQAQFTSFNRTALTSSRNLRRYIKQCSSFRGIATARHALDIILDNSASPAESKLAIALSSPTRFGGFHLPQPTMNQPIPIPEQLQNRFGKSKYLCDLFWSNTKKIALEYDGIDYHSDKMRIASDTFRRNNLMELGIRVYGCTFAQTKSVMGIEGIAKQISKELGLRSRISRNDWPDKQYELWSILFGPKGHSLETAIANYFSRTC